MGLIDKLKLLFKIQKPVKEVIDEVTEAKRTKKWFHFAVTLIGTLGATAAAMTGLIPAQAQLIATTVLQALYNIVRGADKADTAEIKGTFRTTEFWLTALAEIQKGVVAAQQGGINPEWLATSSAIIGAALSLGQNLAARSITPAAPSGK